MKKPLPIDPMTGDPIPKKYDPADFIIAPSDSKGVSHRVTFRLMPDMERAVVQLIQSNRFPFSTPGDFYRWATRVALRECESMEPVVSVTKRIDILSALLNEENAHAEFMDVFRQLEQTVQQYMADQAPEQVTRVIAIAKHQFESMPEGHWRDRYLTELKKRFGQHLVPTKPTASLKAV